MKQKQLEEDNEMERRQRDDERAQREMERGKEQRKHDAETAHLEVERVKIKAGRQIVADNIRWELSRKY